MLLLFLKVASAPALILGGSLVQRRFGQSVGGRFVGLPLTSLPLLALLAAADGRSFAGDAAAATLGGGVAQSAWCLVYAAAARRRGPLVASVLATGGFVVVCLALYVVHLPVLVAAALATASIPGALLVWPETAHEERPPSASRYDLGARMLAGCAFTLAVTGLSVALGARAAGLVGAFPVLTVVLAAATHRRDGAAAVGAFLESVMAASLSVVAGVTVVALALPTLGPLVAFPAALAAAVAAQLVPLGRARRWWVGRPAASAPAVRPADPVAVG
jgi:hypothetical protein